MKNIVSFDKLKLTNNLLDDNGHVRDGVRERDSSFSLSISLTDHSQFDASLSTANSLCLFAFE